MNKKDTKTIVIGLVLSLAAFYFITFIETLLNFSTGLQLRKPLNTYLLWGYFPMFLSGLYIGLSKVRKKIAIGIMVGLLFRFSLWLINDVLIPSPYFDHSFKLSSFSFGLARNGLMCAFIAWSSHKLIKKKKTE